MIHYQLFQRISCSSNEDIVRIKEKLIIRANKHPKEIEAEMKNISQLKQIIDDYLKGKEQTIKIVMLSDLAKELGYILDKYKVLTEVTENEEKIKNKITCIIFFLNCHNKIINKTIVN